MRLLYIPDSYHLIVNYVTKTLSHNYDDSKAHLNVPEYFKLINIIIKFDKDEIQISSIFNYDTSKFTIIETQYHYYMSLDVYTACEISYKYEIKTDFSERLHSAISKYIPNIFDIDKTIKFFMNKDKTSTKTMDYVDIYVKIMDDIYTMSNTYMNIIVKNNDLSKEDLNRLFKITVYFLIPINEMLELKSLDRVYSVNNFYNFYENKFTNKGSIYEVKYEPKSIRYYLNLISEEDRYTDNNIKIDFKTSIPKIIGSLYKIIMSYKNRIPQTFDILPISTLADTFISISLNDIDKYSLTNEHISNLKKMLLFRNTHMNFAFNKNMEGEFYYYD